MAMHEVPTAQDSRKQAPPPAPEMRTFRMNGTEPFYSPVESAGDRLAEARALLVVMAAGFRVSDGEGLHDMNPKIFADALDGIATLIAVGAYQQFCHEARETAHG